MRHVKSERLKKLETELNDLEQWLKLGLVPKSDVEKHKEEILAVRNKIEEEKERLQFLRESGEAEDYTAPKRTAARTGYSDMPSSPGLDSSTNAHSQTSESRFDLESETNEGSAASATSVGNDDRDHDDQDSSYDDDDLKDEESWFSEKNRWRRGGIADPDADDW